MASVAWAERRARGELRLARLGAGDVALDRAADLAPDVQVPGGAAGEGEFVHRRRARAGAAAGVVLVKHVTVPRERCALALTAVVG